MILRQRRLGGALRMAALYAALIGLYGCGSLQPCDHSDLRDRYGFTCALRGMQKPVPRDDRGCMVGTVAAADQEPIVVVAYRQRQDGVEVVASSFLVRPGPYSLAVPPGAYRLAAFQDGDGDRSYDPAHEDATVYHDGGAVVVMPRTRVDRLYLKLRAHSGADSAARPLHRVTIPLAGPSAVVVCDNASS